MANEFIARKGLIVLNNGAKVTGSLGVMGDINATGYNVTASNMYLLGSASIDGDITIGGNLTVGNADVDVVKFLAEVSSSITPDINNAFDLGAFSKSWRDLHVSGTAYVSTLRASTLYSGPQTVNGNIYLSGSNRLVYNDNADTSLLFGFFDGSSIYGPYFQIFGNNYSNVSQRGSAEFVYDTRNGGDANFHIASYDGSTWVQRFRVDNIGTQVTGSLNVTNGITGSLLATNGIVSSSGQIDVRNTTGIATIATTGSNTFTGIQTITDTTNSSTYADGALVVYGGVGIAKDVNISGSLRVLGLLTAVSMSTQYVTSSQYNIGTSRVVVNSDDLVRFGGLTVADSGSTAASGSLLWDSFKNHFIYGTDDLHGDSTQPHSAVFIAGPETYSDFGNEVGLVEHRVPVAVSDHNIDSREVSSSIRIDFPTRLTHIEAGLYVTGAVTSSVGFSGDGSNLTGIVTNLNLSGSQGGTGTVSLKTQALTISGSNGIAVTVSDQTVLVSGSNATSTVRGVAAFTGSNFTVTGGIVSSNPINFNGADINLGGTHAFGLQNITPYGASTTDQVSLHGGAIIQGVLFVTSSNPDVDTGTEIIATISTGSYDAAFFDYVIKNGVNYRVGTVMAVWDGANNVEFTDTSTNDLGSTSGVVFTVDALAGSARLKATVSTDNWIIKAAIRAL